MTNEALEMLKELGDIIERERDDGYKDCQFCSASGWGFIDHPASCVVYRIRALLGKCPHGYPGAYNHGGGPCAAAARP